MLYVFVCMVYVCVCVCVCEVCVYVYIWMDVMQEFLKSHELSVGVIVSNLRHTQ